MLPKNKNNESVANINVGNNNKLVIFTDVPIKIKWTKKKYPILITNSNSPYILELVNSTTILGSYE